MDGETLRRLQGSIELLLNQNKSLNERMEQIQNGSKGQLYGAGSRVKANMNKLAELNGAVVSIMQDMMAVKREIVMDGHHDFGKVEWFYNQDDFNRLCGGRNSWGFESKPKEEKLDIIFGQDGDYSASSLKRFIEKYRVVKKLNETASHKGWDSPEFRANKLKLSLQGDAFDFVSFDDSLGHDWARDDGTIIEKLQDRYLNVQAIENNITSFEKSCQGERELLNEFMTRLKQLVKDAFEGETQKELDRKVAWKFVSGARDEKVRRKLVEDGWMRNRREAKPLEELLKMAELAKRTEVKPVVSRPLPPQTVYKEPEPPIVVYKQPEPPVVVNRVKKPSTESNHSNLSKSSEAEYMQCWFCDSKHKGGWRNCEKRKVEMSNHMGVNKEKLKDKLNSLNKSKSAISSRRSSVKDFQ